MKPVIVLGALGQLGSEVITRLGHAGVPLGREQADITDAVALDRALAPHRPAAVVNCVAYNLVDKAEDERDVAYAVNAWGVRNVAQWCHGHDVPLMHISTDYVYGQVADRHTPYTETDLCRPVGVYGTSKSVGEAMLMQYCPRSWVVRTCGLYGRKSTRSKGNFVDTMLRLGRERPELRIVNDQRCTPTNAGDLAEALLLLLATDAYGLYHATNAEDCTWYEFAQEIFRQSGLTPKVIPITSEEYGAKAPRPRYSVLNCDKLARTIGRPMRPWREALAGYLHSEH